MKFAIEVLAQAKDGVRYERNMKLPLNEKLLVKRIDKPHPKNVESGVETLGTTFEVAGTITAPDAAAAAAEVVRVLADLIKPDGLLEVGVSPR